MSDPTRFLSPEAVKRISRLDLRARHVVEGFLSGLHRSPYYGQSVEFLQHREYAFGDDPRHIDWKVWAKQDRFYVKQFEEDTNLRCQLIVDVSASMKYGNGALNKYEYACTVAASLAYLALRQQDAVACTTFDRIVRQAAPSRTKRNHLDSIIKTLDVARPGNKTDIYAILRSVAESHPKRALVVIISDLLVPRAGFFKGLRLLRGRGHDLLVFHVMDEEELEFPFSGATRFVGMEDAAFLNCNPRALRDGYLAALEEFLREVRRGCVHHQAEYALLRTSAPLGPALASFLSRRMGMLRRR